MFLIDMLLFIVCTSFEKEQLKVLINSDFQTLIHFLVFRHYDKDVKAKNAAQRWFIFVAVPVSPDAKRYLSFIWLVKSTFPKSLEVSLHCFHTSILNNHWWPFEVLTFVFSWAAPLSFAYKVRSLSVLFNLESWVKVYPQPSASLWQSGSSKTHGVCFFFFLSPSCLGKLRKDFGCIHLKDNTSTSHLISASPWMIKVSLLEDAHLLTRQESLQCCD